MKVKKETKGLLVIGQAVTEVYEPEREFCAKIESGQPKTWRTEHQTK